MGSTCSCNQGMVYVPEKEEKKTITYLNENGEVRVYSRSRRNSKTIEKQNI